MLYSNPMPINFNIGRRLDHDKTIEVEHDLTPDEARALGEGGQGSLEPDADAPEQGNGGGGGDAPTGRWTPSEVVGRWVYQRDDLIDPNLTDAHGRSNLERMRRGQAPFGPDCEEINLHYMP